MDVENEVDDDIKEDQEASVAANNLFSNTNPKGIASLLNTHEIQLLTRSCFDIFQELKKNSIT